MALKYMLISSMFFSFDVNAIQIMSVVGIISNMVLK